MNMNSQYRDYVEGVQRAIQDECNTSRFYRRLAEQVPGTLCGDIFATASADEYRHAQMLAALLSCPTPYLAEDETLSAAAICPGDLHKAISGELDAICEYAGLAAIAPSAEARSVLMSILGDEYGHARLFMLLQETGLCCTW
jgi:rubrerythrin